MYLFPFFIIFVVWLSYELKKSSRLSQEKEEAFWENERLANTTRKKNIDNLDYITIPLEKLPFFENVDGPLENYQNKIKILSTKKILNLSGMSNTELKAEYGAANLPLLSECDENFTALVSLIPKWAEVLKDSGYPSMAITVLEYGIEIGSDVSSNYMMLAEHYKSNNMQKELSSLMDSALKLNTIMGRSIQEKLKAFCQIPQ